MSYTCGVVEEPVFIHPQSVLYRQPPRHVVFHQLIRGRKRLYMREVTAVQAQWLARLVPGLCDFGAPADDPPPFYCPTRDQVRCCIGGTFGPRRWALTPAELEFPDTAMRYRHFAKFLLEGTVFPALAPFAGRLKNRPDIMVKPWVKERVIALLQPLVLPQ